MKKIGIISDTHGTVSSKIFKIFKDVDMIIHAGDIVGEDVLTDLGAISEVVAVFGNMDSSFWSKKLKEEIDLEIEGKRINVSHKTEIPLKKGYDVVIRGHTHMPAINTFGRTLFINPGSANLKQSVPENKPSVAILEIDNGKIDAKLVFI
jgi:putative phosphoesterase